MKPVSRAFRLSWRTMSLVAAIAGVACGPERPPAPGSYASARPGPVSAGRQDLPASAYSVEWSPVLVPATLQPGEQVDVAVTVKNISTTPWPVGRHGDLYVVHLSHRWLHAGGKPLSDYDNRTELPGVVSPGHTVTVNDVLVAPTQPGDYVVQFDLVHEGVAWFAGRGAAKQLVPVKVS